MNDDSFESYVKDCLETIRQDVETIKNNQAKFKEDLKTFEQKLERTTESLNLKFDTLNGEVHVAMTRVDKLEDEVSKLATNVNQAYERLLSLERYSRDFNLRFYNIPEDSNENCIEKLKTILSNDLGIKPVIENAHRIGGPRTGASNDPRPVIAKFLYRPERLQVIQNKRSLKNGVRISDDLIWEDRQKKKLKEIMKQAYEEGKKPRFHHGNLYIDGVLVARLSILLVCNVCDKFLCKWLETKIILT